MKTLTSTFIAKKYSGYQGGWVGDYKLNNESGIESIHALAKFEVAKYGIKEDGRYEIEAVFEYGSWKIVSCTAVSEVTIIEDKVVTATPTVKTEKEIEIAKLRKAKSSLTHDEVFFEMQANKSDSILIKEVFSDVSKYTVKDGEVIKK